MSKKVKIEIAIDQKRIVDLFISACEGGSNYWCQELTPVGRNGDAYERMLAGFTLKDGESGKTHRVTVKNIENALRLFASGGSQDDYGANSWSAEHFGNWMAETDDAGTADVFLQLCVFGKVIYG